MTDDKSIASDVGMYEDISEDEFIIQEGRQRVTFYASKIELEIIGQVMSKRKDTVRSHAISQIITEYGSQKEFERVENTMDERVAPLHSEIDQLKSETEILRDRLDIVEAKYAAVHRLVSEIQAGYSKRRK